MEILPKTTKQDNKPKMAYSRNAFTREQQETRERQDQSKTRERQERNQRETREKLERDKRETREILSYGGWPIIV